MAINDSEKPVYPVSGIIATFTSGNWYKKATRSVESYTMALADQVWNMTREGLDEKFS